MQRPTEETIQEWKAIYEEYRYFLQLNFKSAPQVIDYLKLKYALQEDTSE